MYEFGIMFSASFDPESTKIICSDLFSVVEKYACITQQTSVVESPNDVSCSQVFHSKLFLACFSIHNHAYISC